MREIVAAGLAESAHDLSDGGLAVALAECCFGPARSARRSTSIRTCGRSCCCSTKAPSRILISTANPKRVAAIAAKHGVEAPVIGSYNREGARDPAAERHAGSVGKSQPLKRRSRGGTANRMFDKFHDECGVVAIYGHPEASKLAYLGLYALQHRGQESAGICTSDGTEISLPQVHGPRGRHLHQRRAGGAARRAGHRPHALLHRRATRCCSTRSRFRWPATRAGSRWRTTATSPTPPNCARDLERRGSIFQASSDTEVILHLVAHSSRAHAGRRAARCAAATGRRVLAGVSGAGPHHRGARSARLPAAGDGRDGSLGRPQVLRVRFAKPAPST